MHYRDDLELTGWQCGSVSVKGGVKVGKERGWCFHERLVPLLAQSSRVPIVAVFLLNKTLRRIEVINYGSISKTKQLLAKRFPRYRIGFVKKGNPDHYRDPT